MGVIYNLTGSPRSDGGCLLQFHGNPYAVVNWSVISGGGSVTPLTDQADEHGNVYARYNADGFEGVAVIGAEYGV